MGEGIACAAVMTKGEQIIIENQYYQDLARSDPIGRAHLNPRIQDGSPKAVPSEIYVFN